MKLAISYFYQIRNFKPYMIPVSTAVSDPSWFHGFRNPSYTFLDKRGIVNGLRCEELHPNDNCKGLCCGRNRCGSDPSNCKFLKIYKQQLEELDLNKFLKRAENSALNIQKELKFKEEPIVVLIVYEAPNNLCSERQPLIEFFNEHGIKIEELEYPIK